MDNKEQVIENKESENIEEVKEEVKEIKKEENKPEEIKDKQVTKNDFKNPDAFNNKEKILFEEEEEKESNPTGVLIIFVILIGSLFFLPMVDKLIYKNTGKNAYQNIFEEAQGIINQPNLDNRFYFETNQVRVIKVY